MRQEAGRLVAMEAEGDEPLPRVIGQAGGVEPGPTLVCIGGIHGNEPAGHKALERVLERLARQPRSIRGRLVGLAGNLRALARHQRYIDRDLNRLWLPTLIERARAGIGADRGSEDAERQELLSEIEAILARASGETFVLDLHTTSSDSVPFVAVGDTLRNRAFVASFPLPVVLGLEEHVDGTISEYLSNRGHVSLTVETGQHDSAVAVDHAESAIWIAMSAAGLIDGSWPWVRESRTRLAGSAGAVPPFLEVRYRHRILPGDDFRMQPGFVNFDPIVPGQLLARDRNGEIRSRWSGRLLMPLYQAIGADGFFVIREFKPIWLSLSALLRRLHLDEIVHWLPGTSRHPTRPETLVVNRRFVRLYALELLHLLGFRKHRAIGDVLLVSRRAHDLRPPRVRR